MHTQPTLLPVHALDRIAQRTKRIDGLLAALVYRHKRHNWRFTNSRAYPLSTRGTATRQRLRSIRTSLDAQYELLLWPQCWQNGHRPGSRSGRAEYIQYTNQRYDVWNAALVRANQPTIPLSR